MKKSFCAILFLILSSCGLTTVTAQNSSTVNASSAIPIVDDKRGYLLGIGDELEIKVLGEKDFDGTYTIDENGKIQLPFVETSISALCRTERELRLDITNLLKRYLREPQVNVRIAEKHSRPPAVVYGEVRNAQQFDMRRSVSLLELISYTGGTTEQASGMIQVFHTQPSSCLDQPEKVAAQTASNDSSNVPSELYRLNDLRSGKTDANPIVRPGDVVVVLKSAPVYVVGEVRSPQGVYIPERGLSLTDAIAMVGGLNERAKKKDVRIYRLKKDSSEREIIAVNLNLLKKGQQSNVVLQPYDVIEVEKAQKNIGEYLIDFASGSLVTAGQSFGALPMQIVY